MTTNDDLGTLAGIKRMQEEAKIGDVMWTAVKYSPPHAGEYLCYEPNVGPPPDFQWLRWTRDRGWRDHLDNKSFPTHWAKVQIPSDEPYQCQACGLKWDE